MKVNELIVRQDRVVYTLMLLLAGLGLLWSFWQHQHNADIISPASPVQPAAHQPALSTTAHAQ
ncbi:MAG: hypothetical protein EOO36_01170 [Cytophagaceae bacterium]|nr:MAG: hypothetical protein EOO36_01170 [Cytophagaceae bacterium]